MGKASFSADELLGCLSSSALTLESETGKISYVNPAFIGLTGQTAEEWLGKTFSDLIILPKKVECAYCQGKPALAESRKQACFHGAELLLNADGEKLNIKVKHSVLPNGGVLCLLDTFSEDVALTQAHSDFVSTVSHEFRTPLTSIKGFADTLLRYGAQLPEDQQKRFINIIKEQADRLTRLVENLLTVSKLGAARMEMSYRPVPVGKVLEKVVQSIQGKDNSGRSFNVSIPPTLPPAWADPDKLEQILINLVDNAAKYSQPGTDVDVEVKLHPEDPDLMVIRVTDRGVGIPPEHLPKIFTKFSRIDNPLTRLVEGTGLGLYITKSLTTAMGGQIDVESTLNVGTSFIVTLPVASAERQAAYRQKLSDEDGEEEAAE